MQFSSRRRPFLVVRVIISYPMSSHCCWEPMCTQWCQPKEGKEGREEGRTKVVDDVQVQDSSGEAGGVDGEWDFSCCCGIIYYEFA